MPQIYADKRGLSRMKAIAKIAGRAKSAKIYNPKTRRKKALRGNSLMRYWRDMDCRDASTRAYPDKPDSRHAQHDKFKRFG